MSESPLRILTITALLCVVCAGLVAGSVVLLRPRQERNQDLDRKRNILLTAGLIAEGAGEAEILERFQQKVHLQTLSTETAKKPLTLYEIREDSVLSMVVLPIEGKGLWSTLYGFLAVKADGNTIAGLRFYQHGETPGLGGEVDNPLWLALWPGKELRDAEGNYRLEVIKGRADRSKAEALRHQVDGLSGATLTTQGIQLFLSEQLGPSGYGPYLKSLSTRGKL